MRMARQRRPGTLDRRGRLVVFGLLITGLLLAAFVSTVAGVAAILAGLALAVFGGSD